MVEMAALTQIFALGLEAFREPLILLGFGTVLVAILAYIVRYLRQPLLLAYITTGLIIGPIGLNLIHFEQVAFFAELGIALLLFVVGMETDITKILKLGKVVIAGGIFQVLVTVLLTISLMSVLGLNQWQALLTGLIVAFSSTVVVVKILTDSKTLTTLHGRLMLGFLLLQDFLIIFTLPVLNNAVISFGPELANIPISNIFTISFLSGILVKSAFLLALGFVLNKFVFPWLLQTSARSKELLFLITLTNCFAFISLALTLNVPMEIGAFIAGVAMSNFPYSSESYASIRSLRDFFSIIFFVALGVQLTSGFTSLSISLVLALIALTMIIKPLLISAVCLYRGYGGRAAVKVGFGLGQIGEFSLKIALIGAPILGSDLYTAIILVTTLSMVLTPYLIHYPGRLYSVLVKITNKLLPLTKGFHFQAKLFALENLPSKGKLKNHIIVFGVGVTGSGIVKALGRGYTVVAVDHDPHKVQELIAEGYNVVYGEEENEDLWTKIHLDKARLLVITIPDAKAAEHLIKRAKKLNKKLVVFGRASSKRDALSLYEAGADYVNIPDVLAGNQFVYNVSSFAKTDKLYVVSNLEDEFLRYLKEEAGKERI